MQSNAQNIHSWHKDIFSVGFVFSQNDQSTEDLHILGAEDLTFLAEKVVVLCFHLLLTQSTQIPNPTKHPHELHYNKTNTQ